MTNEELNRLQDLVVRGRELLGRITVAKERIAWLEGDKTLQVRFYGGGSSAYNEEAELSEPARVEVRAIVLRGYRERLAKDQAAWTQLTSEVIGK